MAPRRPTYRAVIRLLWGASLVLSVRITLLVATLAGCSYGPPAPDAGGIDAAADVGADVRVDVQWVWSDSGACLSSGAHCPQQVDDVGYPFFDASACCSQACTTGGKDPNIQYCL